MSDQLISLKILVDDSSVPPAAQHLNKLGDSAEENARRFFGLGEEIDKVGNKGKEAGDKVASGMDKIGGHALTSLDNVRLLRDDLGIRIPRSMEKAIANSAVLSQAIGSIGTGLLAVGAIDVFASLAERGKKLYDEYLSLSSVQEQFFSDMEKRRDQDFMNSRSIETTTQRIHDATSAMTNFNEVAQDASKNGWSDLLGGNFITGLAEIGSAHGLAKEGAKRGTQAIEMSPKQIEQGFALKEQQIDADHALDSAKGKQAAITGELNKQLTILEAQRQERRDLDRAMGNKSSSTDSEIDAKERAARGEAQAKEIELSRSERDEVIKARNEARDAGISGEQLYMQKSIDAVNAIVQKEHDGALSRAAAISLVAAENDKYFNELEKRQDEISQKTRQLQAEADQAGMGIQARTQSATLDKLSDTLGKFDFTSMMTGSQSMDDFTSQGVSVMRRGDRDMLEEKRRFSEEVVQLTDHANDAQLTGYARVNAEEHKMMDSLNKRFSDEFKGKDFSNDPDYQKASGAIATNSDRERAQVQQEQTRQTMQLQAEAAKFTSSTWGGAIHEIEAQYDERASKEQQFYNQQVAAAQGNALLLEDLWKQHNDRLTAMDQIRAGQVERQAEQERDAMAGALSSLMKNPQDFLMKRGEQMATELLANNVMKLGGGPDGKGTSVLNEVLGVGGKHMSTHAGVVGDPEWDHFSSVGTHASITMDTLANSTARAAAALDRIGGAATSTAGAGNVPGAPGAGVGTSLYSPASVASGSTTGSRAATRGSAYDDMAAAAAGAPYGGSVGSSTGSSASSPASVASGSAPSSSYGGGGGYGTSGSSTSNSTMSGLSSGFSDVQQGQQLYKQFKTLDAAKGASAAMGAAGGPGSAYGDMADASGNATVGAGTSYGDYDQAMGGDGVHDANGVVGGAGDAAANGATGATAGGVMAAASGGMTVAGAYQEHSYTGGALKGALGGAETGAAIGMMVAGPAGALVGAVGGAVVGATIGLIGGTHSPQAEQYNDKTVKPALGELLAEYDQDGNYMSGENKIEDIQKQAMDATNKMGGAGQRYYQSHIKREIQDVAAQLTREEKAGRSTFTATAAQFHGGGTIGDFGDFGTSGDEGFVHARAGEIMVNPMASHENAGVIHAMNSGKSLQQIMEPMMRGTGRTGGTPGGETHHHWNISAIDTKDFVNHLETAKHHVRRVMNESYSEYGGEAV